MNILVAAATATEIAPFLDQHPAADHLVTGAGVPATIYHLLKRLQQVDYDLVINAGIAGSYNGSLQPGEVVNVTGDCFADLGAWEKGEMYSLTDLKLETTAHALNSNAKLTGNFHHPVLDHLPAVKGNTVNLVNDNEALLSGLHKKYPADTESMEGAAVHFVCLQEKIPFIQIRAISNVVGDRDKSRWEIELAIRNLNTTLEKIYSTLLQTNIHP